MMKEVTTALQMKQQDYPQGVKQEGQGTTFTIEGFHRSFSFPLGQVRKESEAKSPLPSRKARVPGGGRREKWQVVLRGHLSSPPHKDASQILASQLASADATQSQTEL